jgi:hypothetical protein
MYGNFVRIIDWKRSGKTMLPSVLEYNVEVSCGTDKFRNGTAFNENRTASPRQLY